MEHWWKTLLTDLIAQAECEVLILDSAIEKDDSWENIALLVEVSEHLDRLRQAYDEKVLRHTHAESQLSK